MKKKPVKILQIFNVMFVMSAFFLSGILSCGIDEYYHLEKVDEGRINRINNTEATIDLPQIEYNYEAYYRIFYRIYISNNQVEGEINSLEKRSLISSALVSDFNAFSAVTDPTSTSLPSANTFSNRDYFELEFFDEKANTILLSKDILSKNVGKITIRIRFPTMQADYPVVIFNNGREFRLRRSSELISPEPKGDLFFRNTSELSDYEYSTLDDKNKDVSNRSNASEHAYVSMYIVAVGYHNTQFNYIYSKPTHISIFKLPNM